MKYTKTKRPKPNPQQIKEYAHELLIQAFGNNYRGYQWLRDNTSTGHFATMPLGEINDVIRRLKRML